MKQNDVDEKTLSDVGVILRNLNRLVALCIILLILIAVWVQRNADSANGNTSEDRDRETEVTLISDDFEISPFDDTEEGRMAEYGHRLITETFALLGPGTELAITGNKLSCSSCHLNGGTKPYAAPYVGLSGVFPIYIGREDKVVSLEERINGCFERSMNGKAIAVDSKEMRAMISYIKHISKEAPIGKRIAGQGFVDFDVPDRAADRKRGALIYRSTCSSCHGVNGEGMNGTVGNREDGYIYPPLWGDDTYNDGAGMARLITAAKFIKGNMPLGVTHKAPLLSDEEAYDVAAYINSHSRPMKANKELDYPDLSKKPKDSPYPPYNDNIPQEQHRVGPFNF
ncbi:c-type cytochrome [Sphingobacterium arenae]|uniref:C-type cytochrome n=1 Tax=Sphingobacterium arenae TaxID=1280598 RepID=A0ABR7Y1P5_9SPHI|nr:c-type cytochrome [Sphingobacterium arenae]MBD1425223.1 c-type cytochrome [Sphingobacterium arenae]